MRERCAEEVNILGPLPVSREHNTYTLIIPTYLCLKGETNWQYWQLYLSSLLNSAMAEWLLSWDLSPCMDMKTRLHWAHGWPPAANRCLSWPSDTTALAAATRAADLPSTASISGSSISVATATPPEAVETKGVPIAAMAGLSRPSTSAASSPSRLPLVRLSEGRVRGTSLTSCCKTGGDVKEAFCAFTCALRLQMHNTVRTKKD